MSPLDEMEHTLGVLARAIEAKDTEKASEAVAVFLI
jgi:hypothetical protein